MVPPRTVKRDQILAAAEYVIAERGYAGATTKAIARAAHCSEGSLYNHFPDKRALFIECAVVRSAGLIDAVTALPEQVGERTVEANLTELLSAMLGFHRRLVPLLMTTWANGEHHVHVGPPQHEHATLEELGAQIPEPLRGGPHALIANYLDAERDIGRLRADVDTVAAATVLMGIPFNRALFEVIKPDMDMPLGANDWIARSVDVVVAGMRPHSTASAEETS